MQGRLELITQPPSCLVAQHAERKHLMYTDREDGRSKKLVSRQHTAQKVVHVLNASRDADQVIWKAPRRSHLRCQQCRGKYYVAS